MRPDRVTRVAVVGGGPAGIYAADLLVKEHEQVVVDVIERLPAPYGLVRYGVAPDHPRIKEIINALRRVLAHDRVRFLGNVDYGTDLKLDDLRRHYDAVVVATGAMTDRPMDLPGQDLDGSYGAADFVSWYAGHPDVPREWPLDATEVAVLGAGNVGLDVARMLAKPVAEQMTTEIPANVEAGLAANQAKVVHVFARRGPAHAKFSPMELRELSHSPSVDVVVEEEGFEIDDAGQAVIGSVKSQRMVVDTLLRYVETPPTGAPHRIEIHLMQDPVEIVGEDGRVTAIRTARTEYDGTGRVTRTDDVRETPVQAVYRAVGYRSSALPDVPFDEADGVVPNDGGRVLDLDGEQVAGLYCTGWVKRGPVGLIGHTKKDAKETVGHLLADLEAGLLPEPEQPEPAAVLEHLAARGVDFTTEDGWTLLDEHERSLGEAAGRERVKVVERDEMLRASKG